MECITVAVDVIAHSFHGQACFLYFIFRWKGYTTGVRHDAIEGVTRDRKLNIYVVSPILWIIVQGDSTVDGDPGYSFNVTFMHYDVSRVHLYWKSERNERHSFLRILANPTLGQVRQLRG